MIDNKTAKEQPFLQLPIWREASSSLEQSVYDFYEADGCTVSPDLMDGSKLNVYDEDDAYIGTVDLHCAHLKEVETGTPPLVMRFYDEHLHDPYDSYILMNDGIVYHYADRIAMTHYACSWVPSFDASSLVISTTPDGAERVIPTRVATTDLETFPFAQETFEPLYEVIYPVTIGYLGDGEDTMVFTADPDYQDQEIDPTPYDALDADYSLSDEASQPSISTPTAEIPHSSHER